MTVDEQPPGWYPSPDPARRDRFARYWDGSAWTAHEEPLEELLAQHGGGPPAAAAAATTTSGPSRPPPRPAWTSHDDVPRAATRFTWVPKLVIAAIVVVTGVSLITERTEAIGPVGFALVDATTSSNPLLSPPQLRVSSGDQSAQRGLSARTDGGFARLDDLEWSLDAPLRIEFIPAYASEPGHSVDIDVRAGGANGLSRGWFVRVEVTATDRAFEVEVSQPTTRGIFRSRQVVHSVAIPRSNERILFAAVEAERIALREERQRVQQERNACIAEERGARQDAVAPIVQLDSLYQAALQQRRIYGNETLTFVEYRRRITNLVSDMQTHLRDAEQVLLSEPAPSGGSFSTVIAEYATLRQAWITFEVALRSERTGPVRTFQGLYPREFGAVENGERDFAGAAFRASSASSGAISAETTSLCDSRHPLP